MALQNLETASVFIQRSVLDVFKYALRVDELPRWVPWCLEVRDIEYRNGIPTHYSAQFDLFTMKRWIDFEVLEFRPGKGFTISSSFPTTLSTYTLKTIAGNTLITQQNLNTRWGKLEGLSSILDGFYANWSNNALKAFRELVERSEVSPDPPIFLSYHRERHDPIDTPSFGAVLSDRLRVGLAAEFGANGIFFDTASIGGGELWERSIEKAVTSCATFVLLIEHDWLERLEAARRDGGKSWVREELMLAREAGKPIIPIVAGELSEVQANLPEDLRWLKSRNWHALQSAQDFDGDLARIIDSIWGQLILDQTFWSG